MASADALGNSVPDFARELPILLVDHDSSSLSYMASFLELFSFNVRTAVSVSVALSILRHHKKTFKIVMANFDIPDKAGVSLLGKLAECDVPIIFFTSNPNKTAVARSFETGATFLMGLPVSERNLKYIWQLALRSESGLRENGGYCRITPKRKHWYAKDRQDASKTCDGKRAEGVVTWVDGDGSESNTKRLRISSTFVNEQVGDDSNPDDEKGGGENISVEGSAEKEADQNNSDKKKSRFLWDSRLQQKFTAALSELSDADVRPKAIWQLMDVPNLTLRQVASHLQKYKFQVERMRDILKADLQPCKEPCCSRFGRVYSLRKESGPATSKNGEQCILGDPPFSILDQTPTPQSTTTTIGHTAAAATSMGVHPKENYSHDPSRISCTELLLSSSQVMSQPIPPNNMPGGDNWEMDLDCLLDFEKNLSPLRDEYDLVPNTGRT